MVRRGLQVLAAAVAVGLLAPSAPAWGQGPLEPKKYGEHFEEEKPWDELEVSLPEYPRTENLIEFYVSAATPNRFFIDGKSLSVGADGVVRYVAVVKTRGGATNVSFEGIRCEAKQRRLYAFGRGDGAWGKARTKDWTDIRPGDPSGYAAVLYREYFCPDGTPIYRAEEGGAALRRGGQPRPN